MIKAGSLFYTLIITLLIAIVTSSLILVAYYTSLQFQYFEARQQLHRNVASGLNLLLARQSLVELNQSKEIDLFSAGDDVVELSRKPWGAYEILIAKAQFKGDQVLQIAQVGYYPDHGHLYSIYLPDHDKPLALCGKTNIKGTAYLPKAGVKRAYIEGQSFVGSNLINGSIKESQRTLPVFNTSITDALQSAFSNRAFSATDSIMVISGQLKNDSISNSFLNTTLVLKSAGEITLSGGVYEGNIALISDKRITVSAASSLKDVILLAPEIIIENNFIGNLQAFATDSINVGENARLLYPSVLGLLQQPFSPAISAIVLNKNTVVSGNIFAIKNGSNSKQESGVVVKEGALVNGQIHSTGFVDVKGTINGSLMCNKLMLITPSSVYENHLLNAVIDVSQLSEHFAGINLVEESNVKKIARWLY